MIGKHVRSRGANQTRGKQVIEFTDSIFNLNTNLLQPCTVFPVVMAVPIRITADEINCLIYSYLKDSGERFCYSTSAL